MSDVRELVDPPLVERTPVERLERRARSIRRRRRLARTAGAAGVVVVLAAAAVNLTGGSETSRVETVDDPAAGDGLFSVQTGVTLIYDDGYDGIVAVDVDQGVAQRFTFEHKGPGDPSTLTRLEDRLVFSSDSVYAVPLSLEGEERRIRDVSADVGVILLRAGRPDAVWVSSFRGPRSEPSGAPSVLLLGADGEVLAGPQTIPQVPLAGWPEGVLTGIASVGSDPGPRVWDARTTEFGRRLGPGDVVATDGSLLAQADYDSRQLVVTDLDSGEATDVALPLDEENPPDVRFSPDGSRLAIMTGDRGEEAASLHLVDVDGGDVSRISGSEVPPSASVAWTPDGSALFFSSGVFGHEPGRLGYFRLGSESAEVVTADFVDRPRAQATIQSAIPGGPGGAAQITVSREEGPRLPGPDGLPRCRVEFRPGTSSAVPELPVIPPGPCRLR